MEQKEHKYLGEPAIDNSAANAKKKKFAIDTAIVAFCWVTTVVLAVFFGRLSGEVAEGKKSLRVSVAAVSEITVACQGNYKDLSANKDYVYANCKFPEFKPVTVQNYVFK